MNYHASDTDEIAGKFGTDIQKGLSGEAYRRNFERYGENVIKSKKKQSILRKFFEQFNDFMIIVLLAAAGISFAAAVCGGGDPVDPIIILAIVVLNAVMGVVQESKAEKAIAELEKISAPTAVVIREGAEKTVPAAEVVPGDILVLNAGDIVAADARLIEAAELCCNESALTGESAESSKSVCSVSEDTPLAERVNTVYSSCAVTSGRGKAIVCASGMDTEVGRIAGLIITGENRRTPLQNRLADMGRTLAAAALFICVVIFMVGIYKGTPPFDMFITSVSLAVAAIPEGLAAVVTVMLAIGVRRMADCGAVIRHLPSVETLGSADVICSDKTGTLTQNRMRVVRVSSEDDIKMLKLAALCTNGDNGGSKNPTEDAVISAVREIGENKEALDRRCKRIGELPFDSSRKLMSVICRNGGKNIIVTKGAPDILLDKCSEYYDGKKAAALSGGKLAEIRKNNSELAAQGLRVIGVAYKETQSEDITEEKLVFAGLIGIEDPPRKEAAEAIKVCGKAGIRAVMITGDQKATAAKIASDIGIASEYAVTGSEIDAMDDKRLGDVLDKCSVYARVTPEHKMRIVKGFQRKGNVVAMTGDGVNDAPALRSADIGCAMGISGTDVSRAAADMVLTDDNFATIVEAVRQGRGIYDNIHKAVKFLLSSNIGEILTIFAGIIMGGASPLCAVQLLWVNLVTDSLPAVALGLDPINDDIMDGRKKRAKKSLFDFDAGLSIFLEGCMIGALAVLAFVMGKVLFGGTDTGRTMAFCVLSMSQLVHAFNMRSEKSVFKAGIFRNKPLVWSAVAGIVLQVSVVMIPQVSAVFKAVALSAGEWMTVAGLSIMPLLLVELEKKVSGANKEE
ncbi:MAG: cation-translocating P-type ATPase [Oscillospiraceae bacterium]|nr:cation-translocating P-type ATPase [Oscillospiraceae bacterium]